MQFRVMLQFKTDEDNNRDAATAVRKAWDEKYYRLLSHNCSSAFYEAIQGAGRIEIREPLNPSPTNGSHSLVNDADTIWQRDTSNRFVPSKKLGTPVLKRLGDQLGEVNAH